jgi:hypothetical protein
MARINTTALTRRMVSIGTGMGTSSRTGVARVKRKSGLDWLVP